MNRQCRNVLPVCFLAFVYIYDQAFIFLGFCLESTAGCSEWPGPWVSRSERKGLSKGRQDCIPKYINTLDIGTLICFSRNERKGLRNGRQDCLLKYISTLIIGTLTCFTQRVKSIRDGRHDCLQKYADR